MKKYALAIVTALTVGFLILPIQTKYIADTEWYWQILDPHHWFKIFTSPYYSMPDFKLQQAFLCLVAVLLVSVPWRKLGRR